MFYIVRDILRNNEMHIPVFNMVIRKYEDEGMWPYISIETDIQQIT